MVMMWSKLEQLQACCLHSSPNGTPSDGILRFIHRNGFMIVPPSNPPNQGQGAMRRVNDRFTLENVPIRCQVQRLRSPLYACLLHRAAAS